MDGNADGDRDRGWPASPSRPCWPPLRSRRRRRAPNCRTTGNFNTWLADFKKEAAAQGISPAAIAAASPFLVYDQRIVNIDRGQRFFSQTFLEFSDKMLPAYRLQAGGAEIKKWQPMFQREEKEYGVPPAVITGFWGLESDFGSGQGVNDNALKSLATLAFDCRRSDMFRGHLFDALRMIERGDLRPEEMIGSWAGELGQTQMMPSEYYRDAVIYDGGSRRDLIHSAPDVIGSTGKYLVYLGWKRGEPWLQEVRAPANTPWQEADLSIQHPRSEWASSGVTYADGRPLPAEQASLAFWLSLVLPMGRFGPAFLAYDNFQVYLKWNQSLMYALTAGYMATRLDGAPVMHKGGDKPKLSFDENRELQLILGSGATTSAAPTASWASRAAARCAKCRSSSACRRIPGRPQNCSIGCARDGDADSCRVG